MKDSSMVVDDGHNDNVMEVVHASAGSKTHSLPLSDYPDATDLVHLHVNFRYRFK